MGEGPGDLPNVGILKSSKDCLSSDLETPNINFPPFLLVMIVTKDKKKTRYMRQLMHLRQIFVTYENCWYYVHMFILQMG